ncbi:hypothetical protein GALMADRAFT_283723 [Galerina marginata CBS 339.88]|uniref:valine--tRNA ligase n=1 Tax=Galerina marginata (strain CBS 339.88) TaxID=685588 RepID=A0A067SJH5_GALM3|nr:hypothetical protein GALMADRAFT_283723 [Galerina marginata CBS 339.88]
MARISTTSRRVHVISDFIIVDTEFGTGAVKITLVHDPNDYDIGSKHGLEFVNVRHDDGTMNVDAGPKFEGGYKDFYQQMSQCSSSLTSTNYPSPYQPCSTCLNPENDSEVLFTSRLSPLRLMLGPQ